MSVVPSIGRPRTIAETAAFLKCSVRTVKYRLASGALQCTRTGRIVRIEDEHIKAFLEGGVKPPRAAAPAAVGRNPKYAARAPRPAA